MELHINRFSQDARSIKHHYGRVLSPAHCGIALKFPLFSHCCKWRCHNEHNAENDKKHRRHDLVPFLHNIIPLRIGRVVEYRNALALVKRRAACCIVRLFDVLYAGHRVFECRAVFIIDTCPFLPGFNCCRMLDMAYYTGHLSRTFIFHLVFVPPNKNAEPDQKQSNPKKHYFSNHNFTLLLNRK